MTTIEEALKRANIILNKGKPKAEQDWIYLLHHMHPPKRAADMETLHHCFLFEKKGSRGKEFSQLHVKDKKIFQHALDVKEKDLEDTPDILYDHLNNKFKIRVRKIEDKKWAVITGPAKLSSITWSDQDRSNSKSRKSYSV